jgi:hypothetical protein
MPLAVAVTRARRGVRASVNVPVTPPASLQCSSTWHSGCQCVHFSENFFSYPDSDLPA